MNGEVQKYTFEDVLDSSVKRIYVGTDGKWPRNRLNSIVGYLEIDDEPVRIDEIKPFCKFLRLLRCAFKNFFRYGA